MRTSRRTAVAAVVLAVVVLAVAAGVVTRLMPHTALPADTSDFRGVNWADPRDNYASDAVVPSGLSAQDTYDTTYRRATSIIGEFAKMLDANTVRLPINPASVGTAWWDSYRGAIDAATKSGFKVILSYWEAADAKDGRVDDQAVFDSMWDTVVGAYAKNPRVYFEPMNEPFGYSLDEWVALTSSWLTRHHEVPRARVIISGTGYNDDVTGVGAAPGLTGTLLSLHYYSYWADYTSEQDWHDNLLPRIGSYGHRTIIDEAGAAMTTGLNYANHEGNGATTYLAALTQVARDQHMGVVYWPGLRTGDSYSLTELGTDGTTLAVTNQSGLAQLQWGWGLVKTEPTSDLPPAPPGDALRVAAGNRCLDVPGFATTAGTALDLWDCNGGGNQSWSWTADKQLTVYGKTCLSIGGDGSSAGSPAIITDCAGAADQTWELKDDGSVSSVVHPELCLEALGAGTGNGTQVGVGTCSGQPNQQWARS